MIIIDFPVAADSDNRRDVFGKCCCVNNESGGCVKRLHGGRAATTIVALTIISFITV